MKSCLLMRDCLTYSSPPFLYFCKATQFPMAHGSIPFLLLFKHYNYISHSPSLARHQQTTPSFGGNFFSHLGPCSHCRNVLAQSRRESGGAWFPRREAGEQCRKKEAVNEIEGKWKVESIAWMSVKPCFCEQLCSH